MTPFHHSIIHPSYLIRHSSFLIRHFILLLASGIWLPASCIWLPASPLHAQDTPLPPQLQSSVDRGLEWLAKNQNPNTGAWETNTKGSLGPTAAITSLAAMAFMARGHVPGQGPYADHLNHAIDYVLSLQHPDDLITADGGPHSMYEHGISTIMLCEAYGMLDDNRQKHTQDAVAKAVRLILSAQAIRKNPDDQGGWRYAPTSANSDISVSGWQLMALRGAANIGANVPKSALDAGIAYIRRRHNLDGGFAYVANNLSSPARTATGILALELLGQHHSQEALAGGNYLLRNPVANYNGEHYFYTVYYCSQAAWQLGGQYWDGINPSLQKSVLSKQTFDGSWHVTSAAETDVGDAYGTAMALLALTVPYRYLPLYQR